MAIPCVTARLETAQSDLLRGNDDWPVMSDTLLAQNMPQRNVEKQTGAFLGT